jgi:hypothetical protein
MGEVTGCPYRNTVAAFAMPGEGENGILNFGMFSEWAPEALLSGKKCPG